MDRDKLRLHLFEKTGLRIDVDDPVFTIVALNELVLEEMVARIEATRATETEAEKRIKLMMEDLTLSIGVLRQAKDAYIERARVAVGEAAAEKEAAMQRTADNILAGIGGAVKSGISGVIIPAVNLPVGEAVQAIGKATAAVKESTTALNQASGSIANAVGTTTTAIGRATEAAVKGIDEAKDRLNRPWWQPALVVFGAVVFGVVCGVALSTLVGKWTGVLATKAQITELIENQRAISAKLDGTTATKAPRK